MNFGFFFSIMMKDCSGFVVDTFTLDANYSVISKSNLVVIFDHNVLV